MSGRELTKDEIDALDEMFGYRKVNNLNWRMALEYLMRYAPPEIVANIFEEINENDIRVNQIFGKLRKLTREAIRNNEGDGG